MSTLIENLTLENFADAASLADFMIAHGPQLFSHLVPADDSETLLEQSTKRLDETREVICSERDREIFSKQIAEELLKDLGDYRVQLANAGIAFRASKSTMIETLRSEANLEIEAADPQPQIQSLWAFVERFQITVMSRSQEARKRSGQNRWKDEDKLPESNDSGYFGWFRGKFSLFGSKTPQKDTELGTSVTPSQTIDTPEFNTAPKDEVVIQGGIVPVEAPEGANADLCCVGLYIAHKGIRYDLIKPLTLPYEQAKALLSSDGLAKLAQGAFGQRLSGSVLGGLDNLVFGTIAAGMV